jgi:hypothetical protein
MKKGVAFLLNEKAENVTDSIRTEMPEKVANHGWFDDTTRPRTH